MNKLRLEIQEGQAYKAKTEGKFVLAIFFLKWIKDGGNVQRPDDKVSKR